VPGLASIDLMGPHGVLDTLSLSSNAPQVTITSPHEGDSVPISPAGTVTVNWNGSDADGDPLLYSILFTADGGHTWIPVAVEQTATTWDVPVYGGSNYEVKVVATDGLKTSSSEVHFTGTIATPTP
jgi:hypothetical protein